MLNDNFYVITGGPGVGKTTLLNELQKNGYQSVSEVAREIIKEQLNSNGDALPWKNVKNYRDLMLEKSVESYLSAQNPSGRILFFDRGIPDTLAYSRLVKLPITEKLKNIAEQYRYNRKVFILPPWKEIYHTDNERKQDFEEAVQTFEVMTKTYRNLDYELIGIPKVSVPERAEFVIEHLERSRK